jgi:penicillin amidase
LRVTRTFFIISLINLAVVITLQRPIGKIFSPFSGMWASGEKLLPKSWEDNELKKSAKIVWDKNEIPHIFAENLEDFYFLQGYLQGKWNDRSCH